MVVCVKDDADDGPVFILFSGGNGGNFGTGCDMRYEGSIVLSASITMDMGSEFLI